jgi:ATP-binding cassette subfamily B protein
MKYFESRTVGDVLSRIIERHRHAQPGHEPEYHDAQYQRDLHLRRFVYDAHDQPADDTYRDYHPAGVALLVMIVVKKSQKYFNSQQKQLGKINGTVEEVFSGQAVSRHSTGRRRP